ncbi:HAMP domain-containing protein [Myxococcota bacterium]|nr:HAMP domain-containing protein [Myxococcota bacterium]
MWRSLPFRLAFTVAVLSAATVAAVVGLGHRLAIESLAEQADRSGQALVTALAVSHAGELLALRADDLAEMERAATRLVADPATGVLSVTFADAAGRSVAAAPAPRESLAGPLPDRITTDTPARGVRRVAGPVHFGGRVVGAIVIEFRDDLSLRLAPNLTTALARLGLFGAALGAIVVFLLTRRALRTVPALAEAIDRVRQADFSARVRVEGEGELGHLAQAFNEMSRRLELFGQYTNPALIRALIQDPDLALPGGVLRHVTVVFCDMRDFTRMSAQRAPTEVLREVNLYFHVYERVVLDHGGHVDKYMGDAIMAVFGLFDQPLSDLHERLARNEPLAYSRRAVRAMLLARDLVRVLNRFLADPASAPLRPAALSAQVFGCGIASGFVTAGNLGGPRKKDYSVVGAIVNLAARLESQSRQGEVLVDGHTRRNLGTDAAVTPRPPVELKGFERPVTPFEVSDLAHLAGEPDFATYARGFFTEEFVRDAVLQRDPMTAEAEVVRCLAGLRATLEDWAQRFAPG